MKDHARSNERKMSAIEVPLLPARDCSSNLHASV